MLSFGKILLLVMIVVIVIFGFRLIGVASRNASAREAERQQPAPRATRQRSAPGKSADLTACPKCGAYSDGRCDRSDCGLAR